MDSMNTMKKKCYLNYLLAFLTTALFFVPVILQVNPQAASVPGKTTLTKISSPAYNQINIKWKKASGSTNYVIFYRRHGTSRWIKLAIAKSDSYSYTHTSSAKYPIIVGQKYDYTVRAYNRIIKKYGSYNKQGLTARTLPSTVKLGKASLNSDNTEVTISWNKAKGCNYYKIYKKSGASWKKLATVKSNVIKYIDKKPAYGTNTYTVRAYYSKTKVYGKYNTKGVSIIVVRQPVTKIKLNEDMIMLQYKHSSCTLKAKAYPSSADNKTIIWSTSNKKIATVSQNGLVKPVSNGVCYITATAADRKKVHASCIVYVSDCTAPKVQKSKYSYQIFLLDDGGAGTDASGKLYTDMAHPVYIKTDNPNMDSLDWKTEDGVWGTRTSARYDDTGYTKESDTNCFTKVAGGYVWSLEVDNDENNEFIWNNGGKVVFDITENGKVVARFKVVMAKLIDAEKSYVDMILKKTIKNSMTPFEKMEAVCNYFESQNPKYYANDGQKLLNLISVPNCPWFKTFRFDSYSTPGLLTYIARKVGGFDKIENGYSKYYGTEEWAYKHWYVECTIGEETRFYTFCPLSYTGMVSKIQKIDFMNTSKMKRLY